MKIAIKYSDPQAEDLRFIEGKSDWIDLRAAEDVEMKAGEDRVISLGVAMRLPVGYEAHIVPRSSTFKNFKILQVNSVGIIDNTYCGDNDIWKFHALAMQDTKINKGDRICQFRLFPKMVSNRQMECLEFKRVENLGGKDRGGFGSTGVK